MGRSICVNGTTVAQVRRDRVHYLHVELDRHDVVLAEGLPVESYLDIGDRNTFATVGLAAVRLLPSTLVWEAAGYAPLMVTGGIVESVRASLASRAERRARRGAARASNSRTGRPGSQAELRAE